MAQKMTSMAAAAAQTVGRTPEQIASEGRALFQKDNAIAAGGANVFTLPPKIGLTLEAGKAITETKKANDKANYDAGAGAAEAFLNVVKSQSVSLKVYLQRIAETDQQWRKGFRVTLYKARDDMRAYVKAREGMADFDVFDQAFKSAQPRISEAVTFSKAIDAGYVPMYVLDEKGNFVLDNDGKRILRDGYHAIIGASRAFLNASSASAQSGEGVESVGPTRLKGTRGRKAKPVLDKVKHYLLSLSLTVDQLKDVSRMVDTMVKLAEAQQTAAMH